MTILEQIKAEPRPLHVRRADDPHGPRGIYQVTEDTRAPYMNKFRVFEDAYITEVKVYSQWYANKAQFNTRREVAEKEILYYIYGPVIARLNELTARVMDRDTEESLRVISEIHKEIMG